MGSFLKLSKGNEVECCGSNEDLNKKAKTFVTANAALKGKPNMTTADFCKWVNKNLLPNSTLEPGFPRNISIDKWLHNLGFEVLTAKKGIFINGHEHHDVITYRTEFFKENGEDWIPSFYGGTDG